MAVYKIAVPPVNPRTHYLYWRFSTSLNHPPIENLMRQLSNINTK